MSNNIVIVNVSQTQAPAPSTLQQTGAMVSVGATTAAAGTLTLVPSLSSSTALIAGTETTTNIVWASSVVTVTTATPHGIPTGDNVAITVSAVVPTGYNGSYTGTSTGTNTLTYPLVTSPGTVTTQGIVTLGDVPELVAMLTTFFAQGSAVSVEILELGALDTIDAITALNAWIVANPLTVYSFLVPAEFAAQASFVTMVGNYTSTTAQTYFFITASSSNYTSFASLKDCFVVVPAPTIPVTEFTAAGPFYVTLAYAPSLISQVTPTAFSILYGVTAYPLKGNAALIQAFKTAGANFVDTGSEGGISNTLIKWGTTMDLHDFTYWYSVDWMQINMHLALANEIINGSNNPLAPLYYNQNGINRLQARAQQVAQSAVSYGLAQSPIAVGAIAFTVYNAANPNDYSTGTYNGLSLTYTPNRGFISITMNINVTNFLA
jgi:hypothetical protein